MNGLRRRQTKQAEGQKSRRRIRSWALNLLLVAAVLFAVHTWQTRDTAQGAAPTIQGYTLNGPYFDLQDARGAPVLVHFWATWCPICALEEDAIDAIAKDHRVITIAIQSGGPDAVWTHMQKQGLSFPALVDADGSLARAYGVQGVPTSFILNPEGDIAFTSVGLSTGLGLRAKLWWAQ